jgi:sigma-B regulation protein RsbU (phosphoserine phosphatase)
MVAGLTCGPWVGLGAGLIGAAYRLTLGGPTVYSCSLATVIAGFLGGLIWLANKRQFAGTRIAVEFAVMIEGLHMLLTIIMVSPLALALTVVTAAAIPMILANALGMLIFAYIITNLQEERKTRAERDTYLREIERKNTELQIAAEIQQSFLPSFITPIEGFEIAATSIPAKEVGGDFFDVIPFAVMPLKDQKVGIMIADVAGKGIPAALFMVLSRIIMRVNAMWHPRPDAAVEDANRLITADAKLGMFVTLFYGVIDPVDRRLTYTNAGHNPPIAIRPSTGALVELFGTGIALGLMEDAPYTQDNYMFAPMDVLVLYTDGVTEADNSVGMMFGEDRLKSVITEYCHLPADEIRDRILQDVRLFVGDHPQSDDITLMVIKAV